ncbi:hepatic lectin-like [Saccostrea echinata]|uniref:hepatic lectin-like n=1 Tax=Saccostrea echinata TaxID=191078 RepID=UPI002A7FC91B|nr:hepatic lectin-like [Saccostrea echinata]
MELVLLLSCLMVTLVCGDDISNCPTNLHQGTTLKAYQGHCYEFKIHRAIDFHQAESDCKSRGGHVVAVNSMDEQNFIMSTLKSFPFHGHGVWIGFTDGQVEGKWTWTTGETSTFTHWRPGEPDGRKRFLLDAEEDCAIILYSDASGHWDDIPCVKQDPLGLVHQHYPYVCEYLQGIATANTNTSPPPTTAV